MAARSLAMTHLIRPSLLRLPTCQQRASVQEDFYGCLRRQRVQSCGHAWADAVCLCQPNITSANAEALTGAALAKRCQAEAPLRHSCAN